jgi:hypothetical protein
MIDFCKLGNSQVIHTIQTIDDLEQNSTIKYEKNSCNIYNPVTKFEHIMNNFDNSDDEFVIPSFFSGADSFYMCCLHIIDKTIAITKLIDAKVILKSFKRDLAHHLDSEKAVYKKLGFNKRKKLTVDYIRSIISNDYLEDDDIVYIYLSRLLKFDFIIIKGNSTPIHISKKAHTATYIFKIEDNKYSVLKEAKQNADFDTADFIKKFKIKASY